MFIKMIFVATSYDGQFLNLREFGRKIDLKTKIGGSNFVFASFFLKNYEKSNEFVNFQAIFFFLNRCKLNFRNIFTYVCECCFT